MSADPRRLLVVEDTFLITGRGLTVTPLLDDHAPLGRFRFRLTKPDGSRQECKGSLGVVFFAPSRPRPSIGLLLYGVDKSEVPVGTVVWILDADAPGTASA